MTLAQQIVVTDEGKTVNKRASRYVTCRHRQGGVDASQRKWPQTVILIRFESNLAARACMGGLKDIKYHYSSHTDKGHRN